MLGLNTDVEQIRSQADRSSMDRICIQQVASIDNNAIMAPDLWRSVFFVSYFRKITCTEKSIHFR